MAAIRQGQADEGVGAGAEDGAFAHGLAGGWGGGSAVLVQGRGAPEAGDARLVRIGAQQIDRQGQGAADREAARIGDPVLALDPAIVERPVHIGGR